MSLEKNQEYELTIENMGNEGEGIGHIGGMAVFVKDTVPDDVIRVRIVKVKKQFAYGKMMKLIKASDDRVRPKCPNAKQCGGCNLQHISYEKQLVYKQNKVQNCLERIGGVTDAAALMEPIIGMEHPWHYRNKTQFPVGYDKEGNPTTGFYASRSHNIVPVATCEIQTEVSNKINTLLRHFLEQYCIPLYDEKKHEGLVRHILTRVGFTTGEIMVCLVINGEKLPYADKWVDILRKIPGMTSISININRERTNRILGDFCKTLWGQDYITDYIGQVKYQISPLSFYQVNPVQTQKLYRKALEYAKLTGKETVWDLYCGIGTISLFLAKNAAKVYGVEIVPQAIMDAGNNARINGIKNVNFFTGKAEEVLPWQYEKHGVYADVIVVDPPRKGCDAAVLDTMIKMQPKRIVYVSCDPATLARDVKILCGGGYEVRKVCPVDQFPFSFHVETVVKLSLKKDAPKIEVTMEPEDESYYTPEERATYQKIKEYVKDKYGVNVHTAYIAQVKRMCGLEMGENYNKSKKENPEVKQCPKEKVEYIKDALRYFGAI